jgi:hypothetical protein
MLKTLESGVDELSTALAKHVTRTEIKALRSRLSGLLAAGEFPTPGTDWRAIPWPAF